MLTSVSNFLQQMWYIWRTKNSIPHPAHLLSINWRIIIFNSSNSINVTIQVQPQLTRKQDRKSCYPWLNVLPTEKDIFIMLLIWQFCSNYKLKEKYVLKKKCFIVIETAESNKPKSQAYVCVYVYVYMKLSENKNKVIVYETGCSMR